ncbi:HAD family hydrolase [Micromonospora sonneratiae]|uniref:HAD family hydrolase n=1 Tax=Micromonospora sonneratiae TaxID=1184706 RepID=A0ABW3YDR3_9ACTN
MTSRSLAPIVERTRYLLLDFDGPICSVFSGYPAPTIAGELRKLLVDQGVTLPEEIRAESDPLAVLRFTATLDRPLIARRVDDALRAAEVTAVRTATATPYAREVIVGAHQTGRKVAIVSNNSAESVTAYLTAHRLARYVHPVIGRAYADPAQMKPHPAPVLAAVAELHAAPETCVLVGDTPSDIDAAHAARVPAIGYANKPGKQTRLAEADAIITSMEELVTALAVEEL